MPSSRLLYHPLRTPLSRPLLHSTPRCFSTTPLKPLISDAILADHRVLEHNYNQILAAKSPDEKSRWQNQFTWDLARHSISEEIVVYPALETHLFRGRDMADKDRVEHKVVKDLLYKFQSLSPTSPEFLPTIKELWANLATHIKEEEEQDLPALEKTLHRDESDKMVASFDRTKRFIPTRSHPTAPDKPPFETVVGLMAAPMDRLMDLYRKFPEQRT
ncbi:HHE domain protein [Aspergillus sclerotioniger CBS 115572]|uniref:HHE domain protein n=1 Tax=Aspergillus sclerotioniger CBS 115572 TaxID=1450535 RepID=A0A317VLP4_9EURO|nr:HHE domain protein [Aspergillus sclerotioniger CBS 115572]PWY75266.1 HHE domain protein [Aspergillus sclerotioniger CBS 115572]